LLGTAGDQVAEISSPSPVGECFFSSPPPQRGEMRIATRYKIKQMSVRMALDNSYPERRGALVAKLEFCDRKKHS
jgi:hypothetical protein